MSTYTIITVWNKQALFTQFQQALEAQQGVTYTLLAVDNSQNRYAGAREAFLAQLDRVETEYVVFMHQDIRFQDEKGQEPSWTLKGGALSYECFVVTVENLRTDGRILLQPQITAAVIQK